MSSKKKTEKDVTSDSSDSIDEQVEQVEKLRDEIDTNNYALFVLIGFLILILGIFFGIGLYLQSSPTPHYVDIERYNDFVFYKDQAGGWEVEIYKEDQPYHISFFFSPSQVENISLDPLAYREFYLRDTIYIAIDPQLHEYDLMPSAASASVEIGKIVGQRYNLLNKNTPAALTRPYSNDSDVRIFNCSQITPTTGVVEFLYGNETQIDVDGGCIQIRANSTAEFRRAATRVAFQILGIMRDE
ncbi:MAG: hypothetical protein ACMXYF_00165 [Candidatus Woesearchaeota archaeon]